MRSYKNTIRVLTTTSVIAAWAASCAPAQTSKIVITFPKSKGISANAEIMASPSPGMGGNNGFANPTSLDSFQCFGINVTGPGIPDDLRLSGCDQAAQKPASADNPRPGVMGGLASTNGGSIELKVPAGDNRVVQLIGVQTSGGCPSIDDIAKASLKRRQEDQARMQAMQGQPQPGASGMPNQGGGDFAINGIKMGEPYELGRAVTNIRGDTTVSIKAAFDASNPKRVFNNDQCSSGGQNGQQGVSGGSGPMGPTHRHFVYHLDGSKIVGYQTDAPGPLATLPKVTMTGVTNAAALIADPMGKYLVVQTGSGDTPSNGFKSYTISKTGGLTETGFSSSGNIATLTPAFAGPWILSATGNMIWSTKLNTDGSFAGGSSQILSGASQVYDIAWDKLFNKAHVGFYASGMSRHQMYELDMNNGSWPSSATAANYSGTTLANMAVFGKPGASTAFFYFSNTQASLWGVNMSNVNATSVASGAVDGTASFTNTATPDPVVRFAFDPTGTLMAVSYNDNTAGTYVSLFTRDPMTGAFTYKHQVQLTAAGSTNYPTVIAFDSFGKFIYVGHGGGSPKITQIRVDSPSQGAYNLVLLNGGSIDVNDANHWSADPVSGSANLGPRRMVVVAVPQ